MVQLGDGGRHCHASSRCSGARRCHSGVTCGSPHAVATRQTTGTTQGAQEIHHCPPSRRAQPSVTKPRTVRMWPAPPVGRAACHTTAPMTPRTTARTFAAPFDGMTCDGRSRCRCVAVVSCFSRSNAGAARWCARCRRRCAARSGTGASARASALPATRQLATELGISRASVVEAYGRLAAEGFVTSQPGSATRVASDAGAPSPRADASVSEATFDLRPGRPGREPLPVGRLGPRRRARGTHRAARRPPVRRSLRPTGAARGADRLPRPNTRGRAPDPTTWW